MYKPELFNALKGYNAKTFLQDLIAGIIVGIVALPLSIAFAIASGCSPETGLFTAIIAGFCIAAFGGTRCQIGGPTGAFTVIIYAIVNNPELGVSGLATATVLAGVFLILLGVFKLGGLVKFIPYTIVVGFTAGVAVTIATGQIGDFFGFAPLSELNPISAFGKTYTKMPGTFAEKILVYSQSFSGINWYSFFMALICLVIIFIWPKVTKKIPGSLIVIILATVVNVIISNCVEGANVQGSVWHADIIKDRYSIPTTLPSPKLPALSLATIIKVFPTSLSIAVLAAIESLLSAVVADGMMGTKHNSNNELIGQGIANILSPLFGGLPATGALARTATNINNGGKTPIAGIIHAVVLLLVMLFFGLYVEYIPLPALAAVLMSVAWNMAGIPSIRKLLKGQKSDICVLSITFLVTVFVDLTYAILIGLGFAAFFFIKKMIDLSDVETAEKSLITGISGDGSEEKIDVPKGVIIYQIDGPLFFGTVRKFEMASERAGADFKIMILQMKNTKYLDAGGIDALTQCKSACDRKKIKIILSNVQQQPMKLLKKSGIIKQEYIFENINDAISFAENELKS